MLGALGVLDTALVSIGSNLNLGVLLPGILGAPLLFVGVFWNKLRGFFASKKGWRAWCRRLFWAGYAVLFAAFALTFVLINTAANREAETDADALIVLGAALHGETPSLVLKNRLNTAIAYLEENPNTIAVLSGGKGDGEHISEAEGMARYLLAAGIEEERLVREEQSVSTQENFAFSGEMIKEMFGDDARIVFVTTDFHVYRATRVAEKQNITAAGIAAPDVWYIALNNRLRESTAIWAYFLLGRI